LDRVPKLVQVGVLAAGLVSVGWTARATIGLQVGLPDTMTRTVVRVDNLEHRMESAEAAISEISQNSLRLRSLSAKVDSLDALAVDTYCIMRAHALGLDPTAECVLRPRQRGGP
jgi:hypothetical protein